MGPRPRVGERVRRVVKRNQFLSTYTTGLTSEDLQRLFTRDTVEAYRFFTRGVDPATISRLPLHRRVWAHVRIFFLAFTLKLSPARRAVYGIGVVAELLGLIELARGLNVAGVPGIAWPHGTLWILVGFLLMNLLVLLEVADRLSLKNDLDIAREIQRQMLPVGPHRARGVVSFGRTRPANTVGGDFYDMLETADGKLLVAVGDVAGKGSPAALLMALLVAIFRTLVDEGMELGALVGRLNAQVARHAPPSRFITFFVAAVDQATGKVEYVNAGHLPPLVWRSKTRQFERWTAGGIALGMFEQSRYERVSGQLEPGDLFVLYTDGVTEAENAAGQPFEEQGLQGVISAYAAEEPEAIAGHVFRLVQDHAKDSRLADDLTILVLQRAPADRPVAAVPAAPPPW